MDKLCILLLLFGVDFHTNAADNSLDLNCEEWEEYPTTCECQPRPEGNGACCDASTCKLFPNATCAAGECCNLKTCQLKTIATVCRYAANACDLPEFCDGRTAICPTDVYKHDMQTCRSAEYCQNGKCQQTFRELLINEGCPQNCSGNGVCNNLGHCHCYVGFTGETCEQVGGAGGSIDSGPASNPNFLEVSFERFTYIAFCAAIPLVLIFNFLVCVCCRNLDCQQLFNKPRKYRGSQAQLHN